MTEKQNLTKGETFDEKGERKLTLEERREGNPKRKEMIARQHAQWLREQNQKGE